MALFIKSYYGEMNTVARSCQDHSQDCFKILRRSYYDIHGGSKRELDCSAEMESLNELRETFEQYKLVSFHLA